MPGGQQAAEWKKPRLAAWRNCPRTWHSDSSERATVQWARVIIPSAISAFWMDSVVGKRGEGH